MRRRTVIKDRASAHPHGECAHCVPAEGFTAIEDGRPLIGGCRFLEHGFLLSELTACQEFKEK